MSTSQAINPSTDRQSRHFTQTPQTTSPSINTRISHASIVIGTDVGSKFITKSPISLISSVAAGEEVRIPSLDLSIALRHVKSVC